MWKTLLSALILSGLLMLVGDASAANYNFVNIADTRGPFDEFDYYAQAVSDTGTVAFIGYQGGVYGSYVGDGTSINTVVPDLSPPSGFHRGALFGLNEFGMAASTVADLEVTKRILLHEASGTRTIAEVSSSAGIALTLLSPAINNSGAVAFGIFADYFTTSPPIYQGSITRWFDGTSTTVLETTAGFDLADAVGLNEIGDVAFHGFKEGQGGSYHRTDGTTLTQIADSTGPLNITQFSLLAPTAINDSGAVALRTELDAGGEGIFVGDGGPLTTVAIADQTTPFSRFYDRIDINNQGTVAFAASLWDGGYGIFTGPDPVNDKVIARDDLLFGRPLSDLGGLHLNERGDIAFWFIVDDPSVPGGEWRGIALAVRQSPLPGDFDGDGDVDGRDFLVWQRGGSPNPLSNTDLASWEQQYGSGPPLPGDYNGDRTVDGRDFLLWQRGESPDPLSSEDLADWETNYGTDPGPLAAATSTVPEPTTLVLLLVGGLITCRRGLHLRQEARLVRSESLPPRRFADERSHAGDDWRRRERLGPQVARQGSLPQQTKRSQFHVMNPAAVLEGVLEESSRGWSVKEQSFYVVDKELPPSSSALLSVTTDRKGKFRIDSLPTNFDWRTGMRVAKTAIDLETEPFRLEAPGK